MSNFFHTTGYIEYDLRKLILEFYAAFVNAQDEHRRAMLDDLIQQIKDRFEIELRRKEVKT